MEWFKNFIYFDMITKKIPFLYVFSVTIRIFQIHIIQRPQKQPSNVCVSLNDTCVTYSYPWPPTQKESGLKVKTQSSFLHPQKDCQYWNYIFLPLQTHWRVAGLIMEIKYEIITTRFLHSAIMFYIHHFWNS